MIPLPNRILLATDCSEDAALVARTAADLAERIGAELHVVHAWQADLPKAYAVTVPRTSYRWYELQARQQLEEQVEQIRRAGGRVAEAHLARGEAVERITDLAEELDADLVVVGNRGLRPVRRLATGSVSEGVVRDTARPVLVVRGGAEAWPPTRMVVGEDFSEESEAAAKLAAGIAALYEARILLVHAYPLMELGHKVWISNVFWINRELRTARKTLEDLAQEIEEETGQIPEMEVAVGDAAACILECAREGTGSNLIAVGSRGLGILERFKVGSVSTKVVREANGPVLIYRQPEG